MEQPSHFQQVIDAKSGSSGTHLDKWIDWRQAGPTQRQRTQFACRIIIKYACFSPIVVAGYDFESLPILGMKAMRDLKSVGFIVPFKRS